MDFNQYLNSKTTLELTNITADDYYFILTFIVKLNNGSNTATKLYIKQIKEIEDFLAMIHQNQPEYNFDAYPNEISDRVPVIYCNSFKVTNMEYNVQENSFKVFKIDGTKVRNRNSLISEQ